ncbi:hypothetical protein DFR52_106242 [Hoeflea marina]|uniref:Uncharacterized protein n=1 Tax=Hoeflea marina TaxID=274592 RepID=A0A317PJD9_9HYPH|nr:hypothetical protein [Hoeflea marina]PWV97717.1 hypothetical protein DFR52_106242 [Hoeflea marina]
MPFRNIANPDQLALLRRTLEELCVEFGVSAQDGETRDEIARRIVFLFERGMSGVEEMKQRLREDRQLT